MWRLLQYNQLDKFLCKQEIPENRKQLFALLKTNSHTGSLSLTNELESFDMELFINMSTDIKDCNLSGSEKFLGTFLFSTYEDVELPADVVYDLAKYYENVYGDTFVAPFDYWKDYEIPITDKITQAGHCQIRAEIIKSTISSRHKSSSFILAKFESMHNHQIDTYPKQILYFFEHSVEVKEGNQPELKKHWLAYCVWYKPLKKWFLLTCPNDLKLCKVELWSREVYSKGRDSIIPVHQILSHFIPVPFYIGKDKKEVIAVVSLNKCFNI